MKRLAEAKKFNVFHTVILQKIIKYSTPSPFAGVTFLKILANGKTTMLS
jgi:hypothetical protein